MILSVINLLVFVAFVGVVLWVIFSEEDYSHKRLGMSSKNLILMISAILFTGWNLMAGLYFNTIVNIELLKRLF